MVKPLLAETLYQKWGAGTLTPRDIQTVRSEVENGGDSPWRPTILAELDKLNVGEQPDWDTLLVALRADDPLGSLPVKAVVKADMPEVERGDIVTYTINTPSDKPGKDFYDVYMGVVTASETATGNMTVDVKPNFRVDNREKLPPGHNVPLGHIIAIVRNGKTLWEHPGYNKILAGAALG